MRQVCATRDVGVEVFGFEGGGGRGNSDVVAFDGRGEDEIGKLILGAQDTKEFARRGEREGVFLGRELRKPGY
jgi:hypothetical protein